MPRIYYFDQDSDYPDEGDENTACRYRHENRHRSNAARDEVEQRRENKRLRKFIRDDYFDPE